MYVHAIIMLKPVVNSELNSSPGTATIPPSHIITLFAAAVRSYYYPLVELSLTVLRAYFSPPPLLRPSLGAIYRMGCLAVGVYPRLLEKEKSSMH